MEIQITRRLINHNDDYMKWKEQLRHFLADSDARPEPEDPELTKWKQCLRIMLEQSECELPLLIVKQVDTRKAE